MPGIQTLKVCRTWIDKLEMIVIGEHIQYRPKMKNEGIGVKQA
jgi:hypothetical protein